MSLQTAAVPMSQHGPEGIFSIYLQWFLVHHLVTVSGNENASYPWVQALGEIISIMN